MIFDLTQVLKGYDGTDFTQTDNKGVKTTLNWVTVVETAVNFVNAQTPPEEKSKAFFLTLRAHQDPIKADYTVEDCSFILKKIREVYIPLVVGRAEEFFNAKN